MRSVQLSLPDPATLRIMCCTPLLALLTSHALAAATVSCGSGDRVHTELSGGKVGTIEEVGTQAPHVGWYRISFDWTPTGEWYPPTTIDIHPEGSTDRCQPPGATAPASSAADPPAAGARPAVASPRPSSPAPAASAAASGSLALGRYVCSAPGAGHFDIHLLDGSTYSDRRGTQGNYALDGDRIRFKSGSLVDYYSRILGPAKFGLSTEDVRSFYVVCNRKG